MTAQEFVDEYWGRLVMIGVGGDHVGEIGMVVCVYVDRIYVSLKKDHNRLCWCYVEELTLIDAKHNLPLPLPG
jgi:hypothetical protein